MAALKDDQKLFIVQALARFDSPTQVIKDVKLEFGIDVTKQQLQAYNPVTLAGSRMSEKLKIIFAATQKQFLEKVCEVPIANQAVRLRAINRLYEKAGDQGNVAMAAQLLEQAAKEVGGIFTNKQKLEHTGKDGAPIEQRTTVIDENEVKAAVRKLESEY